eukprot:scaffold80721_cov33-Tisochrysis_lutea.AAC.4
MGPDGRPLNELLLPCPWPMAPASAQPPVASERAKRKTVAVGGDNNMTIAAEERAEAERARVERAMEPWRR